MPLTQRRVPLRITLTNLGFPKKEMWQAPRRLRPLPFRYIPEHAWPEQIQRAFHEHRSEVDAGKLQFNHDYEKAWRLADRRFSWRGKDWKDPIVKLGDELAAKETLGRSAFEAYRDVQLAPEAPKEDFREFRARLKISEIVASTNPMEMKLEVKDRMDFGGLAPARTVA